jgi:hypothetical protein
MKTLLALYILLAPLASAAQNDLIVPAGTQKTLTPEERTLSLKKFSLGDNVTIFIPPGMNGWTVTATDASIGNNVKIISQGTIGYGGTSGSSAGNAPNCIMGMPGGAGLNGQNGPPGKNISLNLKIRSIGSLTIDVPGSAGGNGGYGGNGGKGGNSTCTCNAGNGGAGGKGGNGGNGGMGGTVSLIYGKIGNVNISNSNFIIRNTGGSMGFGAGPGAGGPGGEMVKCPDSKAALKTAGAPGINGHRGISGVPGRNGTITISTQ